MCMYSFVDCGRRTPISAQSASAQNYYEYQSIHPWKLAQATALETGVVTRQANLTPNAVLQDNSVRDQLRSVLLPLVATVAVSGPVSSLPRQQFDICSPSTKYCSISLVCLENWRPQTNMVSGVVGSGVTRLVVHF